MGFVKTELPKNILLVVWDIGTKPENLITAQWICSVPIRDMFNRLDFIRKMENRVKLVKM